MNTYLHHNTSTTYHTCIYEVHHSPYTTYFNSRINPTTTTINSITATTSFKNSFIVSFFILILQTDFDIIVLGRRTSPPHYWMLSRIILMTITRVPISRASCVSDLTIFTSLFIFFLPICVSSFLRYVLFYRATNDSTCTTVVNRKTEIF